MTQLLKTCLIAIAAALSSFAASTQAAVKRQHCAAVTVGIYIFTFISKNNARCIHSVRFNVGGRCNLKDIVVLSSRGNCSSALPARLSVHRTL